MRDWASCSFWAWSALCLPICIVVPISERWTPRSSPLIWWVSAWRRVLRCRWIVTPLCLFWSLTVIGCILLIFCDTIVKVKRFLLLYRCADRSCLAWRSDIYILLGICCRKYSGFSHVLLSPSLLGPSLPKITNIYKCFFPISFQSWYLEFIFIFNWPRPWPVFQPHSRVYHSIVIYLCWRWRWDIGVFPWDH